MNIQNIFLLFFTFLPPYPFFLESREREERKEKRGVKGNFYIGGEFGLKLAKALRMAILTSYIKYLCLKKHLRDSRPLSLFACGMSRNGLQAEGGGE